MTNSDMFQHFLDETNEIVGLDRFHDRDKTVPLFHLLAAALDWCDTNQVDFNTTLEEVRESFADEGRFL